MAHELEEASTRRVPRPQQQREAPEFLEPEPEVSTRARRVPGYGLAPFPQRSAISASVPVLPSIAKTTVAVPRRRSPRATPDSFAAPAYAVPTTQTEISQFSRSMSITSAYARKDHVDAPHDRASASVSTSKVRPFERQMIVPSIYPEPKVISKSIKEREAVAPEKKSETPVPVPAPVPATATAAAPAPAPAPPAAAAKPTEPAPEPPAPEPPAPEPPPESEMQLPPGMAMFDPLMVPVPPELAPAVYQWVRRIALQSDLSTADRILRDALLELSNSLAVSVVYPGEDGLWTLGAEEEVPKDPTPMIACAQARKALISSHSAIIPVVTSTETVAVVVLTRNPRNPAYHPLEAIAALGFVRECAAVMHHLVTSHLQKQTERAADKGSLYRGEALEAHRNRGTEGAPVTLSPGWVKRTYPFLLGALVIAIIFAMFIKVPTYASGQGAIVIEGEAVAVPVQGVVKDVFVTPGMRVIKGNKIVSLQSQAESDEVDTFRSQYNDYATAFLFDPTDENNKKQLDEKYAQLDAAEKRLAQKTIRAPRDGIISDVRIQRGAPVSIAEPVATIIQEGAEVQVLSFVPSHDQPSLRIGATMQVDLIGHTKVPEKAKIISISNEAIGAPDIAKYVGPALAQAMKIDGGTYTVVRAKMPSNVFTSNHQKLFYHHGMQVKTDILITEKPFLATLLPGLEKYIPD